MKNNTKDTNMDEDKAILVSVFSSKNAPLFQIAKSLLNKHGIKFWSNDEYMNLNLIGLLRYPSEIKVFEKDEKAAKKLLSELTSNQYIPSNKFDKKNTFFHRALGRCNHNTIYFNYGNNFFTT